MSLNAKQIVMWIAVAIYVISPVDLMPGLPFDDAAAVFAAAYSNKKLK